jgi:hypothetical protein
VTGKSRLKRKYSNVKRITKRNKNKKTKKLIRKNK